MMIKNSSNRRDKFLFYSMMVILSLIFISVLTKFIKYREDVLVFCFVMFILFISAFFAIFAYKKSSKGE